MTAPAVFAPSVFPIFLKLAGRKVLLVGGGRVAAAKLPPLLHSGALVTVVALEVLPEVAASGAEVQRRAFDASDLNGAWLVVAAAPPPVNAEVERAASARRIFVNAVDDRDRATAYMGGVLRKGPVTIAVSTDGRAPALAGLIREGLEELLPDDVTGWASTAAEERRRWRAAGVPLAERRPRLLEALVRRHGRSRARGGA